MHFPFGSQMKGDDSLNARSELYFSSYAPRASPWNKYIVKRKYIRIIHVGMGRTL